MLQSLYSFLTRRVFRRASNTSNQAKRRLHMERQALQTKTQPGMANLKKIPLAENYVDKRNLTSILNKRSINSQKRPYYEILKNDQKVILNIPFNSGVVNQKKFEIQLLNGIQVLNTQNKEYVTIELSESALDLKYPKHFSDMITKVDFMKIKPTIRDIFDWKRVSGMTINKPKDLLKIKEITPRQKTLIKQHSSLILEKIREIKERFNPDKFVKGFVDAPMTQVYEELLRYNVEFYLKLENMLYTSKSETLIELELENNRNFSTQRCWVYKLRPGSQTDTRRSSEWMQLFADVHLTMAHNQLTELLKKIVEHVAAESHKTDHDKVQTLWRICTRSQLHEHPMFRVYLGFEPFEFDQFDQQKYNFLQGFRYKVAQLKSLQGDNSKSGTITHENSKQYSLPQKYKIIKGVFTRDCGRNTGSHGETVYAMEPHCGNEADQLRQDPFDELRYQIVKALKIIVGVDQGKFQLPQKYESTIRFDIEQVLDDKFKEQFYSQILKEKLKSCVVRTTNKPPPKKNPQKNGIRAENKAAVNILATLFPTGTSEPMSQTYFNIRECLKTLRPLFEINANNLNLKVPNNRKNHSFRIDELIPLNKWKWKTNQLRGKILKSFIESESKENKEYITSYEYLTEAAIATFLDHVFSITQNVANHDVYKLKTKINAYAILAGGNPLKEQFKLIEIIDKATAKKHRRSAPVFAGGANSKTNPRRSSNGRPVLAGT